MYSEKDSEKLQDFMKDLGFSSDESSRKIDVVLKEFAGKVITIKNGELRLVGKLHSATLIFGEHLNLTEVQEDKCDQNVLKDLDYYHPRNYKPELGQRNFLFVSAAFDEDPAKKDLLVVPTEGCSLECDGKVVNF